MERVKFLPRPVKRSPLLPTESVEEYERDRSRIENALDPCDAIEQIYFEDFVYGRLQMRRLQRWNLATVKAALVEAVYAVLRELNELENIDVNVVVGQWCTDPVARATVSAILAKHGLDESAIEAEAFSPKFTAGKRHRSLSPDGMAPAGRDQCRELDGNGFCQRSKYSISAPLGDSDETCSSDQPLVVAGELHACSLGSDELDGRKVNGIERANGNRKRLEGAPQHWRHHLDDGDPPDQGADRSAM
jgi:hypothetical protein